VNSPDTFLLLAIKEAGASDVQMIAVYIFYNLMYALLATPVGVLADRWGREKVLLWAVLFFAITYAGITILTDASYFYVLFGVYALAMSGMESVVKAIIANKVPREDRGKALGFYASANSIGMLIAGVWAGWLWKFSGPDFVFGATAMGAVIVAVWLWFTNREKVYLDK
jgi:MFS family permease